MYSGFYRHTHARMNDLLKLYSRAMPAYVAGRLQRAIRRMSGRDQSRRFMIIIQLSRCNNIENLCPVSRFVNSKKLSLYIHHYCLVTAPPHGKTEKQPWNSRENFRETALVHTHTHTHTHCSLKHASMTMPVTVGKISGETTLMHTHTH
jgi:hypothetical protein